MMIDTQATLEGMRRAVELTAQEIIEYHANVSIDDLGDQITEAADNLVNVYYEGCAIEWLAAGMPEAVDYGADDAYGGSDEISGRISTVMFFWYEQAIRDELAAFMKEGN